jgi:hypothetical protein
MRADARKAELLRRATAGAPDEATRRWLSRLLDLGERAAGPDGGHGGATADTAGGAAKFATRRRRPRRPRDCGRAPG